MKRLLSSFSGVGEVSRMLFNLVQESECTDSLAQPFSCKVSNRSIECSQVYSTKTITTKRKTGGAFRESRCGVLARVSFPRDHRRAEKPSKATTTLLPNI